MARYLETAKLFLIDEQGAEHKFFYRVQVKAQIGGETYKTDEWIPVTEDVFRFLQRESWRSDKREERESRCLIKNKNGMTVRCLKDCERCPLIPGEAPHKASLRTGVPLSLDKLVEDGQAPKTLLSVEEIVERDELIDALYLAIGSLEDMDQYIVRQCYLEGQSERQVAKEIGVSQKTVNNRKKKILDRLNGKLKDFSA